MIKTAKKIITNIIFSLMFKLFAWEKLLKKYFLKIKMRIKGKIEKKSYLYKALLVICILWHIKGLSNIYHFDVHKIILSYVLLNRL